MSNLKQAAIIAAILFCDSHGVLANRIVGDQPAQQCRTIEYAELKDMSKPELLETFCKTQGLRKEHDLERQLANAMNSNGILSTRLSVRVEAEETQFTARCEDEEKRIASLYQKTHNEQPACSTATNK